MTLGYKPSAASPFGALAVWGLAIKPLANLVPLIANPQNPRHPKQPSRPRTDSS